MNTKTDREMFIELFKRIEAIEARITAINLRLDNLNKRTKKDIVFGSAGRNK